MYSIFPVARCKTGRIARPGAVNKKRPGYGKLVLETNGIYATSSVRFIFSCTLNNLSEDAILLGSLVHPTTFPSNQTVITLSPLKLLDETPKSNNDFSIVSSE